jgi:hypothetical protein
MGHDWYRCALKSTSLLFSQMVMGAFKIMEKKWWRGVAGPDALMI